MSAFPIMLMAGALIALPASASLAAEQPGSVAYPNNPTSGTPSSNDGGKPVALGKETCTHPGCPDVPDSPGGAGNTTGADQKAGIRTPATAYPGSPVKTPATAADGKAPN